MNQEAIEKAVAHYRELLLSQAARAEQMNEQPAPAKKETPAPAAPTPNAGGCCANCACHGA